MKGSARAKARRATWVAQIGYDPMRLPPGAEPPPPPAQAQAPASKDRRAAWLASIGAAAPKSTADHRKEQVAEQVAKAAEATSVAHGSLPAPLQLTSEAVADPITDDLPDDDDDLLMDVERSSDPVIEDPVVAAPESSPTNLASRLKKKRGKRGEST
jgi:hypothetical protein